MSRGLKVSRDFIVRSTYIRRTIYPGGFNCLGGSQKSMILGSCSIIGRGSRGFVWSNFLGALIVHELAQTEAQQQLFWGARIVRGALAIQEFLMGKVIILGRGLIRRPNPIPWAPNPERRRTQGFTADPDYWKGEVFVYVGRNQNLKDLKDELSADACANGSAAAAAAAAGARPQPNPSTLNNKEP